MKALKHLNKYLIRYKWLLVLGTLFVIISNVFQIVPAQLVRYSIDLVIENLSLHQSLNGLDVQEKVFSVFAYGVLVFAALILIMALLILSMRR